MTTPPEEGGNNGTSRYRLDQIEGRLTALESYQPAVTNERLSNLAKDVQALKRSFYTFCLGVVGSSILFALSVFALLGRHG